MVRSQFASKCEQISPISLGEIGELTVKELDEALVICLRGAHEVTFLEEIECLKKGRPIPQKSALQSPNPFLCDDEVVHVRGGFRTFRFRMK